jgi:hypothetical protein
MLPPIGDAITYAAIVASAYSPQPMRSSRSS